MNLNLNNLKKFMVPCTLIVIVLLIISYNVSLEPENTTQALRLLSK